MMIRSVLARFALGDMVRHRDAAFRGVVVDVDPRFAGREGETGDISPEQPFYQVLALGADGGFIAYAPEDALELDPQVKALSPMDERRYFNVDARGRHAPRAHAIH
ncbi:heat shock protein HspQ [Brevundimonas sp.]|uniref:heat shock protein HspQ n=1 Tax=Brevundimonas sp. TaxID=1871086 RepID=UPI0025BA7FA3|nr:heat shock protein HspQ [Brevundimonas sp.]